MSLVNDMLRDLDRRKRGGEEARRVRDAFVNDAKKSRSGTWVFLGIAGVGVVVGLGVGFLYFSSSFGQAAPSVTQLVEAAPARGAVPVEVESVSASAMRDPLSQQSSSRPPLSSITAATPPVSGASASAGSYERMPARQQERQEVAPRVSAAAADPQPRALAGTPGDVIPQPQAATQPNPPAPEPGAPSSGPGPADTMEDPAGRDQVAVATPATLPGATSPEQARAAGGAREAEAVAQAQVKQARELEFAEKDRNNSQEAIKRVQRGQLLEAYEQLLTFLEENPQAHRSRETLATIMLAQQEYQQARVLLQQGRAMAPHFAPYKKLEARLLLMQGNAPGALNLLQETPPALRSDLEYHDLLASLYQQVGEHAMAVETYQALLRQEPAQARWWAALGISQEALGNVREAVASYQTAVKNPQLEAGVRQYSQNRIRSLRRQL